MTTQKKLSLDSEFESKPTTFVLNSKSVDDKYFTPSEVETHNSNDDLWLSWLGSVYNLTPLAEAYRGNPLMVPILKNAGKDISHWFDPKTQSIKMHIHPLTGVLCSYTPEGRFLHIPPPLPRADAHEYKNIENNSTFTPWWLDSSYRIGRLSQKTRKVKIINTLTRDEHVIEVCSEEKLSAIQERYLSYNSHAKGYMWKRLCSLLDMSLTLEQNGIKSESEQFDTLGLDEDQWLPALHLYFSDDLTVA
ncbi:Cytochrome b5 domain-containing protein 1 [Nowakowskiella sp. JEL0078]|nr:Cytochrome b5 domain-containing protein 1 [Nowakowskiella sp. JEL0078]